MRVDRFMEILGSDFYVGVPDSQLKALCCYLAERYGVDPKHHIIAANEGNCAAIATGYHLATGKVPVVYMQNSGEGNIVNPVTSLLHEQVYAIPLIFVIGWRGEPGVKDEPQHIYQGQITLRLLEDIGIEYFVVNEETTDDEILNAMARFRGVLDGDKSVAFVIGKGGLTDAPNITFTNNHQLRREDIIRHIVDITGSDPVISTTGKTSRELFEIREANGQGHKYDFLTVGSMGHSSSIGLGVALHKANQKIWCIDGDGAALMHMGAMAVIGAICPHNFVHVLINNEAHETVGGMPTVGDKVDFVGVAKACGYPNTICVDEFNWLDSELEAARMRNELSFIEVKCSIGARENLRRPTTSTIENKLSFMSNLKDLA